MTSKKSDALTAKQLNENRTLSGRYIDLALMLGISVVALSLEALTSAQTTNIALSAMGLIFLFFVPGYTLAAALFPGKDDIGNFERAVISFGLSIAVVTLMGFVLNYSQGGITFGSYLVTIYSLVVIFTAIAILRRHDLPREEQLSVDLIRIFNSLKGIFFHSPQDGADKALSVILIVAILVSASLFGYLIVSPKQSDTFTELFLVGKNGKLANYTTTFQMGKPNPVTIVVTNHEQRVVTYDLVVSLNNSNKSDNLYSEKLILNDNETWQKTINVSPDTPGDNQKLQILLYADGNTSESYRECHLWVNVTRTTSG